MEMENQAPQEVVQSQETSSVTPASAPTSDNGAASTNQPSEIDRIAKKIRHDAYEKGRIDAMNERQQSAPHQSSYSAPQSTSSMGGIAQMSQSDLERLIEEKTQLYQQQASQMAVAQQAAYQFFNKLGTGAQKYQDFDDVVGKVNMEEIAPICRLANAVDNTSDVMYELCKNPGKMGSLLALAQTSPALASMEMARISQSMRDNEKAAANYQTAKEPLSQVSPSTTGMDSGQMTVKDYRTQPWLQS